MSRLSRRRLMGLAGRTLAASAIGTPLMAVVACAPTRPTPNADSQPAPPAAVGTGVAAASTPRVGGTLRCATIGDFATLEGQTLLPSAIDVLWSVWDRLTYYDDHLQPQPMLAESWDVSSDLTQIKLNLRRGVQFHTGRELTADDVKWSLERVQDPKIGSVLTGPAQYLISGVEVTDKYTVVVKTSRQPAELFDALEYVNMVDPVTAKRRHHEAHRDWAICFFRVCDWRSRAPHPESKLLAHRSTSFG